MMIESDNLLRLVRQCQLLDVLRSTYYYRSQPIDGDHLVLLRKMDEQYLNKTASMMKMRGIISIAPPLPKNPEPAFPASELSLFA